jgi:hypothetical protein
MILCHPHRYIFLKTTKTAGTSLEIALSKFCGDEDVITPIALEDEQIRIERGYRRRQRFLGRKGQPRTSFFDHIDAAHARHLIGPEQWDGYFKFAVTRNPYDQAVSLFFWYGAEEKLGSFYDFLKNYPDKIRLNWRIITINGRIAVDHVLRYETLPQDLSALSDRLGLPENLAAAMQGIRAKSGVRDPSRKVSDFFHQYPKAKTLVDILCEDELTLFNYSLDQLP